MIEEHTHDIKKYIYTHAHDTLLPRPTKQTPWRSRKFYLATPKIGDSGHQTP
jgi:hypothetical protein